MKKNILFIIGLALSSNALVANSTVNQVLGITAENQPKQVVVSKIEKEYIAPKKSTIKNPNINRLMKYTKIKRTPQKETAYGLKIGYKISKNISVSVDVLAQVDIRNSKIKSKEANLQFALSL
jgi:hypothetical protein